MPVSFPASPSIGQTSVQNGRTYTWSGYAWELTSNVSSHASTHAAEGSDPITAADIGAAATSHVHALSSLTQSGATTGQLASWDGSAWVPATPSSTSGGGYKNILLFG
jgi:hypothetical protein